jgi:hypothetical protein
MFTLFFGGNVFAPNRLYDGKPVQQVLNDCFINCFQHLAQRLVDLEAVIGFEFINEPSAGYIGMESLEEFDPIANLIFGDSPKPLQSFALGDGMDQTVGVYVKSWPFPTKKSHDRVINPRHLSAWTEEAGCVWKEHGVWKLDDNANPVLADPAYFSKHPVTGEKISFYRDCYMPIVNRYNKAIQSVKPEWYCLVEPLANEVGRNISVYIKYKQMTCLCFPPSLQKPLSCTKNMTFLFILLLYCLSIESTCLYKTRPSPQRGFCTSLVRSELCIL